MKEKHRKFFKTSVLLILLTLFSCGNYSWMEIKGIIKVNSANFIYSSKDAEYWSLSYSDKSGASKDVLYEVKTKNFYDYKDYSVYKYYDRYFPTLEKKDFCINDKKSKAIFRVFLGGNEELLVDNKIVKVSKSFQKSNYSILDFSYIGDTDDYYAVIGVIEKDTSPYFGEGSMSANGGEERTVTIPFFLVNNKNKYKLSSVAVETENSFFDEKESRRENINVKLILHENKKNYAFAFESGGKYSVYKDGGKVFTGDGDVTALYFYNSGMDAFFIAKKRDGSNGHSANYKYFLVDKNSSQEISGYSNYSPYQFNMKSSAHAFVFITQSNVGKLYVDGKIIESDCSLDNARASENNGNLFFSTKNIRKNFYVNDLSYLKNADYFDLSRLIESPDGKHFLYSAKIDLKDIVFYDDKIVEGNSFEYPADWSPDGKHYTYYSEDYKGGNSKVYIDGKETAVYKKVRSFFDNTNRPVVVYKTNDDENYIKDSDGKIYGPFDGSYYIREYLSRDREKKFFEVKDKGVQYILSNGKKITEFDKIENYYNISNDLLMILKNKDKKIALLNETLITEGNDLELKVSKDNSSFFILARDGGKSYVIYNNNKEKVYDKIIDYKTDEMINNYIYSGEINGKKEMIFNGNPVMVTDSIDYNLVKNGLFAVFNVFSNNKYSFSLADKNGNLLQDIKNFKEGNLYSSGDGKNYILFEQLNNDIVKVYSNGKYIGEFSLVDRFTVSPDDKSYGCMVYKKKKSYVFLNGRILDESSSGLGWSALRGTFSTIILNGNKIFIKDIK